jgi:hypothetical protein
VGGDSVGDIASENKLNLQKSKNYPYLCAVYQQINNDTVKTYMKAHAE